MVVDCRFSYLGGKAALGDFVARVAYLRARIVWRRLVPCAALASAFFIIAAMEPPCIGISRAVKRPAFTPASVNFWSVGFHTFLILAGVISVAQTFAVILTRADAGAQTVLVLYEPVFLFAETDAIVITAVFVIFWDLAFMTFSAETSAVVRVGVVEVGGIFPFVGVGVVVIAAFTAAP